MMVKGEGQSRFAFSAAPLLRQLLGVLRELDGYFVFADEEGEQYVVMKRDAFERRASVANEVQLPLPTTAAESASNRDLAEEILDRINREVAAYYLQQAEEEIMEPKEGTSQHSLQDSLRAANIPPARRVRFEPLRGDLPPELQE